MKPILKASAAAMIACGVGFFHVPDATAAEAEKSWEVSSYLQLDPMNVPVLGHSSSSSIVTLVLHASDRDAIGRICGMMPRIRDAILRTASLNPARVVDGKLVSTELARDLPVEINRVLQGALIKNVIVFPGVRKTEAAGSVSKLPFANKGCYSVPEAQFEPAAGKSG